MAKGESAPSMDDITEGIDKISVRSGAATSRSPAAVVGRGGRGRGKPSPASSDWALGRGQHSRRHRPWSSLAAERGRSNHLSMQSLDGEGEEEGGESESGSAAAEAERTTTPPTREQREAIRLSMVGRKKDFKHMERVRGRLVNVLQGLELHTGVFSAAEQRRIVDCVYELQEMGRNQQLRERTYSEPRKWMRGKGRVTLQFGCCYNYAVDKNGNPPGIIRDEEVDPIPPLLKMMIKRMVAWHVLPPTCIPNSCIVNIYDKDDCIPPHIDHHDFVRPFCTVSFLSECKILFGTELKILGPGEFAGSFGIPLPVGSVLILNGNGADVAKHCVPAVPSKRISITFRKMDDSKLPYRFLLDPELHNLRPVPHLPNRSQIKSISTQASPVSPSGGAQDPHARDIQNLKDRSKQSEVVVEQTRSCPPRFREEDFPSLGCTPINGRPSKPTPPLRQ